MHIQLFVGAASLGVPLAKPPHPPDFVVAVDGGIALVPDDLTVDLLIGDFDSVPTSIDVDERTPSARIERLPTDKDVTDFEASLAIVLADLPESIHVVNGVGDRLDHLLALFARLEHIPSHVLVTAQIGGVAVPRVTAGAPFAADLAYGSLLSIVPCSTGISGVTTTGLRWQLNNEMLPHGTGRGLSNEVVHPHVQITALRGSAFVITNLPTTRTTT